MKIQNKSKTEIQAFSLLLLPLIWRTAPKTITDAMLEKHWNKNDIFWHHFKWPTGAIFQLTNNMAMNQ